MDTEDAPREKLRQVLRDAVHGRDAEWLRPDGPDASACARDLLAEDEEKRAERLQALTDTLSQIDAALREYVVSSQADLLRHSARVGDVERIFTVVSAGVEAVQRSLARLRDDVVTPLARLDGRVTALTNAQDACVLLRALTRYQQLLRRLLAATSPSTSGDDGPSSLTRAAQTYTEISDLLAAEPRLGKIGPVARNAKKVAALYETIEKRAVTLLQRGLSTRSRSDLATATSTLQNLRQLERRVHDAFAAEAAKLEPLCKKAFVAGTSRDAVFEERMKSFWQGFEAMALRIADLVSVLERRRDALSQRPLAEFAESAPLCESTVEAAVDAIASAAATLDASSSKATGIGAAFPTWRNLCEATCSRLLEQTDSIGTAAHCRRLLAASQPLEHQYLAKLLEGLAGRVDELFASGAPTSETVADFAKDIIKRVDSAGSGLRPTVLRECARVVRMVAARAESSAAAGRDAVVLASQPTVTQRRNAALLADIHQLRTDLAQCFVADETAERALHGLEACERALIAPLFGAWTETALKFIAEMHSNPSYVSSVLKHIRLLASEGALSRIPAGIDSASEERSTAAVRIARALVAHASFLRPLEDDTAVQLFSDADDIAAALVDAAPEAAEDVSAALDGLRAVVADQGAESSVRGIFVVLHEMRKQDATCRLPHEIATWSPLAFEDWLYEHDDVEALNLVDVALEAWEHAGAPKDELARVRGARERAAAPRASETK